VNDGAAALIVASEKMAIKQNLTPVARIVGMATAGVEPRIMGYGPVPATQKLLSLTGVSLGEIGVIELNEAFAAQAIAVMRALKLSDDDDA
jgi:acetyl-CoA C-acetyltransferase